MISATRAMKARDVSHHETQVSYIITLKPIQMHVGIFSPVTISPCDGVAKDYTPIKLRKHMGESQLSNTTMLN